MSFRTLDAKFLALVGSDKASMISPAPTVPLNQQKQGREDGVDRLSALFAFIDGWAGARSSRQPLQRAGLNRLRHKMMLV